MEFRKVFDLIPDEFDRWRPQYCPEAFADIIRYADLKPSKKVLEIGPGTGQATKPLLMTDCDYVGIELGEHLYDFTKKKFANYPNCHMINGDFCTYDFADEKYDMIFSAATIQWIPENIAFKFQFVLLLYFAIIANNVLPIMFIQVDLVNNSNWRIKMELCEMLNNIKSKEDFIAFLKELENDYISNGLEWDNTTIDEYLNSISGWLEAVLDCG